MSEEKLAPELSGIAAHANPHGELVRYEQPDVKPTEPQLATAKPAKDVFIDNDPFTPVVNAPYTTENQSAVPTLLQEIVNQDV